MSPTLPRWAWIGALLVSLVLGTLWHLPLRLALRLAGAGAVTEQAALEGSVTRWQARTVEGIEIRFEARLATLLTLRYGGRLDASRGPTRFTGHLLRGWDGTIVLEDGALEAGLAPLAATLGMPPSLLEGQLRIAAVTARWRDGALSGLACSGEVLGVRGGSGVDAIALGDLGVVCADGPAGPTATIEDRGGPLAFHAELRFAPDGRFLLSGTAGARPGAPAVLAQVLPLFGRSSGPDQVSFRYAGELPGAASRAD